MSNQSKTDFDVEAFEQALKDNNIVRYQKHFQDVVKSYLKHVNKKK